jgi:hypothetical protein
MVCVVVVEGAEMLLRCESQRPGKARQRGSVFVTGLLQ